MYQFRVQVDALFRQCDFAFVDRASEVLEAIPTTHVVESEYGSGLVVGLSYGRGKESVN